MKITKKSKLFLDGPYRDRRWPKEGIIEAKFHIDFFFTIFFTKLLMKARIYDV